MVAVRPLCKPAGSIFYRAMPRTAWVGGPSVGEDLLTLTSPVPVVGIAQRARLVAAIGDGSRLPMDFELRRYREAIVSVLGRLVSLSEDNNGAALADLAVWATPLLAEACRFAHALAFRAVLGVDKVSLFRNLQPLLHLRATTPHCASQAVPALMRLEHLRCLELVETSSPPEAALRGIAVGAPRLTALAYRQSHVPVALAQDAGAAVAAVCGLRELRVLALDFAGLGVAHLRALAPLVGSVATEARPPQLVSLMVP